MNYFEASMSCEVIVYIYWFKSCQIIAIIFRQDNNIKSSELLIFRLLFTEDIVSGKNQHANNQSHPEVNNTPLKETQDEHVDY